MINDRGRIKWAPFLIPEHRKRIAQLYEQEDDVEQPELDEQMLDTLQETIVMAVESEWVVNIQFYRSKRLNNIRGVIHKVDPVSRKIEVENLDGQRVGIDFQMITNISID
ncbi:YolD-like family protein [Paenibacillus peoriae]|uniref:YolD-like family protein n=1 Tax=Paenibacillus peoriae TaxID=59893 RepID=A0A7H0Y2L5_9BACL|nr:YolD-like family protein [Paenibacillus peoriae]QNR65323.1 YolD-like family protein [Paenibacillus peoriae]